MKDQRDTSAPVGRIEKAPPGRELGREILGAAVFVNTPRKVGALWQKIADRFDPDVVKELKDKKIPNG